MGVRTVETRTCEICGSETAIDWGKTDDLRKARLGWGSISISASGYTVDGVSFDARFIDSKTVCPWNECNKSAFEDLLVEMNARLREEFEKALVQMPGWLERERESERERRTYKPRP